MDCVWWITLAGRQTLRSVACGDLVVPHTRTNFDIILNNNFLFITNVTNAHKLQSKVQVIRNTAYQSSMQASYMIGSGTTIQENQPAVQIAARHNIFSHMAPYISWIFLVQLGIDPGISHLGGKIVSHYTTDAWQMSQGCLPSLTQLSDTHDLLNCETSTWMSLSLGDI